MERSVLKEKQRNGIEIAKRNGVYSGKPKKYHEKHKGMAHAIELYEKERYTVKEICEITKVSRSALYRVINEKELVRS
jgi:DNA invertase Pin-like site-specific DNA recombinase